MKALVFCTCAAGFLMLATLPLAVLTWWLLFKQPFLI